MAEKFYLNGWKVSAKNSPIQPKMFQSLSALTTVLQQDLLCICAFFLLYKLLVQLVGPLYSSQQMFIHMYGFLKHLQLLKMDCLESGLALAVFKSLRVGGFFQVQVTNWQQNFY